MLKDSFFILAGIIALLFSADVFVRGAVSIAKSFRLSDLVIGGTIVAIGTSAPELVINIAASISDKGHGNLVLSNIVGSNLVNLCLGLGITSQIIRIEYDRRAHMILLPLGLVGVLLLYVALIPNTGGPTLPRWLGVILVLVFVVYMSQSGGEEVETPSVDESGLLKSLVYVVGGCVGLAFFGDLVVKSAVDLSVLMNVPEEIIGATVVAAGGSLPEIASCFAAARQGRPTIALGNIAGSQIFNIFGILGISAVINPVQFEKSLFVDAGVLAAVTVLVILAIGARSVGINKVVGRVLMLSYAGYLWHLVSKLS